MATYTEYLAFNSPGIGLPTSSANCHPKQHYKLEASFQPHNLQTQYAVTTVSSSQRLGHSTVAATYIATTLHKVSSIVIM